MLGGVALQTSGRAGYEGNRVYQGYATVYTGLNAYSHLGHLFFLVLYSLGPIQFFFSRDSPFIWGPLVLTHCSRSLYDFWVLQFLGDQRSCKRHREDFTAPLATTCTFYWRKRTVKALSKAWQLRSDCRIGDGSGADP